ncbi:TetR/AcrR family transcriptional regulator [Sinomonas susongensis]|uniref:TetR/AcrR family transcriptional regulator n=1 Tax=Sinomonas susongensis TaxID=1324851 RepID=UPI0011090D94|nr:TetR/AcrR family transcriptional regulator [Sinomonas susongensis]
MTNGLLPTSAGAPEGSRETIILASCELFRLRGVDRVSVEDIIDRAGVAKSTFYSCFHSKEELAVACLRLRHEARMSSLRETVQRHGGGRADTLRGILSDLMDQWFLDPVAEVRVLSHALGPHGEEDGVVGRTVAGQLREFRDAIAALSRDAGLLDPEGFAWSWEIAVKGALISAFEGDTDALQQAESMTGLLLAEHAEDLFEDGL